MNAIVSIDVATLTPATVFAPGGVEAIISKIEAEVSAEVFTLETPEGRERIKSVAYRVARSKTALDEMGKELVADIKAKAGAIDAERRTIRERLDALKESVRGPLTAWEDAEADRIALHESALVFLVEAIRFATPPSAATIRERMQSVRAACDRDWQEFSERAQAAAGDAGEMLGGMLATAEQAELDAAELAMLRRQKAEREEADRKAEVERSRVAHAAEAAARQAEAAADRAEQHAERERLRAQQVEIDRIAAATLAVEQERERVARVKADEERATAKREANAKHRAKVRAEICNALRMEIGGITDEQEKRIFDAIAAGAVPHVSITY